MKLLMHTCCAPCSVYCIDTLKKEGIEPTIYWYNPNIHPYMEYKARRDTLKEYAKSLNLDAIFDEYYGLDEFCKNVIGDISNRCTNYCYPVRLRKTFEYAKENGYDAVTTTSLSLGAIAITSWSKSSSTKSTNCFSIISSMEVI